MKHEMKLNNGPFERIKNEILCKKTSDCSEAISKTKNLLDDTSFYSSCN